MSEVPKEPGRWACKPSANAVDTALIGRVHRSPVTGLLYFVCSEFLGIIEAKDFHEYDWHRIELPEGWE